MTTTERVYPERKNKFNERAVSDRILTFAERAQAYCWCQQEIVRVDWDVVRRCETGSCGRPSCTKGVT